MPLARLRRRRDPIEIFELVGVGSMRTRLDISRARGFSRLIGRADELATLDAALERALAGQGRVVGVVAEAGVGKSRLCHEFAERCRGRNINVYEAHCPAHGKTIPLLPVHEILREYFGIEDEDRGQAVREKIAGRLLLLDRAFAPRGQCDFVRDIAAPLPMIMIGDMLGVEPGDRDKLLRWSDDLINATTATASPELQQASGRAAQEYMAYAADVIADRRRKPPRTT